MKKLFFIFLAIFILIGLTTINIRTTVFASDGTIINDNSSSITYSGIWTSEINSSAINGDAHYTNQLNTYAQYTFSSSDVSWVGQKDSNFGKADVYIDDILQSTVDCYSSTNTYQNILFQKTGLTAGTHTIKIVCKSGTIDLDAFEHISPVTIPTPPQTQYVDLAANKLPITSSPFTNISRMTDGNKNTYNYMDSYPNDGLQWIQLDLGSNYNINNIKLWHYFGDTRSYHDVIVQLSNDPTFAPGVITVFNNDIDNSAKMGVGSDNEYIETSAGKDISFNSINGRYVRFYSNGSTANTSNHYVEVEIYDGVTPIPIPTPTSKPLEHASTFLNLPTYDGSNMSTHPAVQYFPNKWNGHKYWMVMTPNTGVSDSMENPSIYTSEDGINWLVPVGLTNPIAPRPPVGHNCDTDILYNSITNELWIYYVESDDLTRSYVKVIKSSDGLNWSTPQVVVNDSRAKYSTLSPTVVYMHSMNKYYMWSVNTENTGWQNQNNFIERRESIDGINWSDPIPVTNFIQPGYQIWHIFIRYVPSKDEYWAIFAAYPNGSASTNTMLYYAKSIDGMNWTSYTKPALDKGNLDTWDDKEIYRSCFVYDSSNDMFKVWYSGIQNKGYIWKIGCTENTYTNFMYNLIH